MGWVLHQTPPIQHQLGFSPPPPSPQPIHNLTSKISPSILLIIVILAVIFFISGLLHLLARYLLRPIDRETDDSDDDATDLQGRLQQLFHLHDAGVDQSFIDTLPVFLYNSIVGLKDPFDCAVCLCEFEGDDKLRLLPKCSHAFHLECIDTWLLSHSTCPLCRRSLLPDFSPNTSFSPLVLVLESASNESSREMIGEGVIEKAREVEVAPPEEKVVTVKLGKFRNGDASGEGTSVGSSNLDRRRCFSMGSYEYVMNESSLLRVSVKPSKKKPGSKKQRNRLAMSECDCHSRREGFDQPSRSSAAKSDGGDTGIRMQKKESFSISKIWLRSKRDASVAVGDSSRRAFSFRLPLGRHSMDDSKPNCERFSPRSEYGVARWEKSGSEVEFDVESGSCNNSIVGSLAEETPSFARRTLLWIVGRQNRVGDHVLSQDQ